MFNRATFAQDARDLAALLADMGPEDWVDVHGFDGPELDRALVRAGIECRTEETKTPTDSLSRIDGEPTTHYVTRRYYGAGEGTA